MEANGSGDIGRVCRAVICGLNRTFMAPYPSPHEDQEAKDLILGFVIALFIALPIVTICFLFIEGKIK